MSRHVTDAVIAAFADGALDDDTAAAVALHLDDCPACAARAVAAEPLAAAFAAVDDPRVPSTLALAAIREATLPAPTRAALPATPTAPVELVVGSALIAAATLVAWTGGDVAASAARFARVVRALADASGGGFAPPLMVVPLVVVLGFGVVVWLGRTDEDESTTWGLR